MRTRRRRSAQAGFTLIELMISLVLFSFVIAGVLAVAVSMAAGFREQKVTIGAESSSRAVMEFMADAIRAASPGVPTGATTTVAGVPGGDIVDLGVVACEAPGAKGAISVTDSDSVADELRLVFAYGSVVTSSTTLLTNADNTLDVVDASQLAAGDSVLVTNHGTGHIVKIDTVSGNQLTLEPFSCSPLPIINYNAGAVVIRVARAVFTIANQDGIPTLYMDADAQGALPNEPMAEGIEDMQLEIGVDLNGDGQLTENGAGANDDEWIYNVSGEVMPAGTPSAIRISLLARAVGKLSGIGVQPLPALGNRPAGSADNFRRRVLVSIVEIRNLQGSK